MKKYLFLQKKIINVIKEMVKSDKIKAAKQNS